MGCQAVLLAQYVDWANGYLVAGRIADAKNMRRCGAGITSRSVFPNKFLSGRGSVNPILKLVREAEGAKDIRAVLFLEFLCAVYLGVSDSKSAELDRHTYLKISDEVHFINRVAVGKGIAIKENIAKDEPACKS